MLPNFTRLFASYDPGSAAQDGFFLVDHCLTRDVGVVAVAKFEENP